jgi:hypothetical protein
MRQVAVHDNNSMGLMKAFHFLLQQQRRTIKKKFDYVPNGTVVHARRRLREDEANQVNGLVSQLNALDPKDGANDEAIKSLLTDLSKQPVKFVPIKRQFPVDYSKPYPYRSTKRGG